MSLPWNAELCEVVREASNEASIAGAPLSSAFLLRALLAIPSDARSYLASQGVSLRLLDTSIPRISPEEGSVIERVYDRARRVAASARQDVVTPLHLLTALADEGRAEAYELLQGLGVDLRAVRTMALSLPNYRHASTSLARGQSRRRTREITIDTTAEQAHRDRARRQIGFHPALHEVTSLGDWSDDGEDSGAFPILKRDSDSQVDLPTIDRLSPDEVTGEWPVPDELGPTQGRLFFPEPGEDRARLNRLGDGPTAFQPPAQPAPFESPTLRRQTVRGIPCIDSDAVRPSERPPSERSQAPLSEPQQQTENPEEPPSRPRKRRRTAREIQEDTAQDLATRLFGRDGCRDVTPRGEQEERARERREQAAREREERRLRMKEKREQQQKDARAEKKEGSSEIIGHTPRRPRKGTKDKSRRQGTLNIISSATSSRKRSPIMRSRPRTGSFDRFQLNPKHFPTLAKFGRNLLAEARENKLDPVIGREDEIDQLIDVLNKRRSNNPVLVGSAGVGKTAIVEGLARLMAEDEPPAGLDERTVIALDVGTLLCGTQLRGSFQERLIGIRSEVKKARGRIIIFLDELHTWMGAGSGDAGSDAAGELKMALARGELPCIGATTDDEFKRFIEADPAFERRFEMIEVKPPSVEISIEIIEGIINRYADHHAVEYADDAVESAVLFSDRYVNERTLPDKAIGILDRAGSLARRGGAERVQRLHIAQVVASQTDMNPDRLLMEDRERFLQMEEHLHRNLIGHSHVVGRIARTVRRNYAGFSSNRPIGSFLFLGPTGVGKTETVKVLAEFLFGSRDAIVRFDMSEFMEQHAVARLIGAPPGYVGFEHGGQLTEAVRRRPHQVVLLDEIEKAHPDVLNILLQFLDEGRLTDGKGKTVDFSNTMVIMTSNLGVDAMKAGNRPSIGFAASESLEQARERVEKNVLDQAKKAFPPELWNRIEERLVFHTLEQSEIASIALLQLEESASGLRRHKHIRLRFCSELTQYLIDNGGYDPTYGARPMRKTIQRLVEAPVADAILRGTLVEGDCARVFVENDRVCVEPVFDHHFEPTAAVS